MAEVIPEDSEALLCYSMQLQLPGWTVTMKHEEGKGFLTTATNVLTEEGVTAHIYGPDGLLANEFIDRVRKT